MFACALNGLPAENPRRIVMAWKDDLMARLTVDHARLEAERSPGE